MNRADELLNNACEWLARHHWVTCAILCASFIAAGLYAGGPL